MEFGFKWLQMWQNKKQGATVSDERELLHVYTGRESETESERQTNRETDRQTEAAVYVE